MSVRYARAGLQRCSPSGAKKIYHRLSRRPGGQGSTRTSNGVAPQGCCFCSCCCNHAIQADADHGNDRLGGARSCVKSVVPKPGVEPGRGCPQRCLRAPSSVRQRPRQGLSMLKTSLRTGRWVPSTVADAARYAATGRATLRRGPGRAPAAGLLEQEVRGGWRSRVAVARWSAYPTCIRTVFDPPSTEGGASPRVGA